MLNKARMIEAFEDEIKEANESGNYDTAETFKRVVAKCRRSTGWTLFFGGCVIIGYVCTIVKDSAISLITKLR